MKLTRLFTTLPVCFLLLLAISCTSADKSPNNDAGSDYLDQIEHLEIISPDFQISDAWFNDAEITEPNPVISIRIIDVGQGNATLIEIPDEISLLFDSGRKVGDSEHIFQFLENKNPQDTVFITSHFDSDHIGAMDRIICGMDGLPGRGGIDDDNDGITDGRTVGNEYGWPGSDDFLPGLIIDRGLEDLPDTIDMLEYTTSASQVRTAAWAGQIIPVDLPGLKIEIVASNGSLINDNYVPPNYENDRSLALLIEYHNFKMLIPSDLPAFVESQLAQLLANRGIDLDLLHIGHHGSYTSTDPLTLNLLTPETAVISVGNSPSCGSGFNSYGHPSQETLDNLAQADLLAIYQTQEGGASMETGTCNPASGQIWPRNYHNMNKIIANSDLLITSDGSSYTVNWTNGSHTYDLD
ncbi:MAG: ComEC/Rec2 family competence protein [Myxococcota bacterium]